MNILVTGSEGFIASHVRKRLRTDPDVDRIFRLDPMEPRVHGEDPEIPEEVIPHTAAAVPYRIARDTDVVLHLGAQVGVADSMEDPHRYLRQNSLQTAEFLQSLFAHNAGPEKLVVASSMSVYGPGGHLVSEADPVQPESVYGLTKYDQERLTLMWGKMENVDAIALRYFNVFGPGQALDNSYTGVVANFARRLLNGKPPIVYEDGQQTRDFIYVTDVADATYRAATEDLPSGTYNVCRGEPITIERVARTLANALGRGRIEPEITGEYRDGDVRHCTGDPSKLRKALGWTADVGFREGMIQYADWLRDHV